MIPTPRPTRVPLLAAMLALMLVVSCSEPICGCFSHARGVVYGRVTDPSGAGVANSLVRAGMAWETCEPGAQEEVIGFAHTLADGRYRVQLRTIAPPDPSPCLRAWADPPALTSLRGSDTVAFAVELRQEGPVDSVRVDLVLRAP